MIDLTQIARARQVDLLRLVEPDTSLTRIANTHGGEYAGPCPFCGGVDRFHVVPTLGKWYCRQCIPRGGDAIDYAQRRQRLAFPGAVAYLVGHPAGVSAAQLCPGGVTASRPDWARPGWQQSAQALLQRAEAALADDLAGAAARAYLTSRGFDPETWRAWHLGCGPAWHPVRRQSLPALMLPWCDAAGRFQAVQYRFFGPVIARRERYGQKAGGQRLLFGLPLLAGRSTLIITEGELNAIACWQVARAWADVLSVGSQENARRPAALAALVQAALPYRQVIVWLDERDQALALGDRIAPCKGTALWSEEGLDANDLLQRGLLTARLADAGQ